MLFHANRQFGQVWEDITLNPTDLPHSWEPQMRELISPPAPDRRGERTSATAPRRPSGHEGAEDGYKVVKPCSVSPPIQQPL